MAHTRTGIDSGTGVLPRVDRRRWLQAGSALAAVVAWPAIAQSSLPRIGILAGGTQADTAVFYAAFVEGMRELGYRDGQTATLLPRYADYSAEKAQQLAIELAAQKPTVIVAAAGGIVPAFKLMPAIPLVVVHSGDPVVAGFAESFPRPGRHATGVSLLALDLVPKRLELLREVLPGLRRIAFLASPEHAGQQRELAASGAAASKAGVEMLYQEARTPAELASALTVVASRRPDAAMLFSDALMIGQRQPLAEFFLKHRIPSAAGWVGYPEAGHLMSYGPERRAVWKHLASFVDKIVRGAKPAEVPIELPTAFELVVNLRTASSMGLTLPSSLLLRADRTIE
jgi:putative tryptophan/tyrosine transport system substrate-binding protein